jgi:DinB superfamily
MPTDLAELLRQTIDREIPELRALTAVKAARAPKPGSWSPKQELGHLIDSAANNHMRFVVASIEGAYEGTGYTQDGWVEAHGYHDLAWPEIVELWYRYNLLLVHLIGRITEERLESRCVVGSNAVTLRFLIEDYVLHMQHHIDHVLSRPVATPYPRVSTTD